MKWCGWCRLHVKWAPNPSSQVSNHQLVHYAAAEKTINAENIQSAGWQLHDKTIYILRHTRTVKLPRQMTIQLENSLNKYRNFLTTMNQILRISTTSTSKITCMLQCCMSGYLFKYCKLDVVIISKWQNQNEHEPRFLLYSPPPPRSGLAPVFPPLGVRLPF